ncbi:MAG: hypothetical protein HYU85_01220 [Chloroflexi bacterium]|nr:hypothetical protein [Chloroflexota bacterium]MBI3931641.1 hypothetical protein [Chloroflexota bacterium]
MDDKLLSAFIDFIPNEARNEMLRPQYESELKERLINDVPNMVSRLAELDPIITIEVGEYIDFMREAVDAFQFGLWRAVVALIGIAAESFTDTLYSEFKNVTSTSGVSMTKEKLFGRDDYIPEERKLAVLFTFGTISSNDYERLRKIKNLRDRYVHPKEKAPSVEKDAREVIRLFRSVIKERFDRIYTIKEGKIVKR